MDKPMQGKAVIVTGAASGIGKCAALLFARNGAQVAVVDHDEKGGMETAGAIVKEGGNAVFIGADVSKSEQVKNMVAKTVKTYGKLDYAFNNAGIFGGLFPLDEYSEETWDRSIEINLKGIWLCMKHEIPEMLKNGGGAIANTSSAAGLIALPNHYAYVASKFGVIGITKVAALEFANRGIRVNCICPAIIDTPMTDRFVTYGMVSREQCGEMMPIKRLGTPEEVAQCAIWLCSDAASYVTGHSLCVDGGYTAQ